jgi:hypothetical protein
MVFNIPIKLNQINGKPFNQLEIKVNLDNDGKGLIIFNGHSVDISGIYEVLQKNSCFFIIYDPSKGPVPLIECSNRILSLPIFDYEPKKIVMEKKESYTINLMFPEDVVISLDYNKVL